MEQIEFVELFWKWNKLNLWKHFFSNHIITSHFSPSLYSPVQMSLHLANFYIRSIATFYIHRRWAIATFLKYSKLFSSASPYYYWTWMLFLLIYISFPHSLMMITIDMLTMMMTTTMMAMTAVVMMMMTMMMMMMLLEVAVPGGAKRLECTVETIFPHPSSQIGGNHYESS